VKKGGEEAVGMRNERQGRGRLQTYSATKNVRNGKAER